jgi:hypothetical protein
MRIINLTGMTRTETEHFKGWITKQLEARNWTPDGYQESIWDNPVIGMAPAERCRFNDWVAGRLETQNLIPEKLAPESYLRNSVENFYKKGKLQRGTKCRWDIIAKGLGHQNFFGLYEDYKKLEAASRGREGGAA